MAKNISFYFIGKKICVSDYRICSSILSKTRGLMFRSADYKKPLLFLWKNPKRYAIHSFFCRKFVAVWVLDSESKMKVIDVKIVMPFKSCVVPREKFNLLLEIPFNYFKENKTRLDFIDGN
jgi:uncharacterized membrane protein (UPF0127 family)